ncbi:MAG: NAD(P)/FAD-dependent oxidoreductase [Anaerolineae bacterium]|nr:NAD(P)/FAD-dependent oxidoreductase [Anaerolineae bacterium]
MNIGIIGAGVAGMSAAWDFVKQGHEVTIYEAEKRVGGLASGFSDDNWDWSLEKFYHHWFQTDQDLLKLIEEMGVSDKVLFPRPKTSYWIDGKMYRSEISPSAMFLPLPFFSKMRFGLAGVFIKLTPDWKSLEKVTANEWFLKYMGEDAYGKFFRPLLIGKFGEEYDKVNMAWMWARVKARSLRLGTFEGGFQAFMDTLAKQLEAKGVTIHLETPIQGITAQDGKPALAVNGETQVFDRVLATTSPGLLLKLAPELRETDFGKNIASLHSIGAVCVVIAIKQQLMTDGTYWLNLPAKSADKNANPFPFLALVEHTNWMDKAHYGGDHILYCGDYAPVDHEYFKLSDDEIVERFIKVLPTVNPAFNKDWIRKTWVFRAPYAQPVPYVNHSEHVPPLDTPIPGLYWASMSHVYPWDRGTNFAVEIGRRAAGLMLAQD